MNSILKRRRAMMGAKGKDKSILWQTKNQSVSGGLISTLQPLCAVDQDFSIAYDVSLTTVVDSGDSSAFRLVRILNEPGSAYTMAVFRGTAGLSRQIRMNYMGTEVSFNPSIYVSSGDRLRFVYYHAKNSGTATCIMRLNNDSPVTKSVSHTFVSSSKYAVLGQTSGVNALPVCTLNEVTLYNRVLSADEINAFLGVT